MKQLYTVILLFFLSMSFAQDGRNPNGEIPGFRMYPNPVTEGRIYITTNLNAPKQVVIFDVFGTQVLETTILGKELNLSPLVAGVYVLRVTEKGQVSTRKLIVK